MPILAHKESTIYITPSMEQITGQAQEFIDGAILLFDKPLHWTSFDIVSKVKSLLRHKKGIKKIKVGHAGTLDPLASGLLIVCTGKKTKSIESFQQLPKEYTGTFFLGATTPSWDLETQPDTFFPTQHITTGLIESTLPGFQGSLQQVPPLFSAKKIEGERAYNHARRGQDTVLKPNNIFIHEFQITRLEMPEADFRVVCSKGTYIRSLAYDFGKALQSGAYLKTLRRTKIGDFSVDQAWNIQDFEKFMCQP